MRIEGIGVSLPANLGKPHPDRAVRPVFAYGRRHEAIQAALRNRGHRPAGLSGIYNRGYRRHAAGLHCLVPDTSAPQFWARFCSLPTSAGRLRGNVRAGTPFFNMVFSHAVRRDGVGFIGAPGQTFGIHSLEGRMNKENV